MPLSLRDVPAKLHSKYGELQHLWNYDATETEDIYCDLGFVANKDQYWFGLNLIKPNFDLPNEPWIKKYILTFHGDPIDEYWLLDQLKTIPQHKIIVFSGHTPSFIDDLVETYSICHLHLLSKWYAPQEHFITRPLAQRKFKWSMLANRETPERTVLASLLLNDKNGILGINYKPSIEQDTALFMQQIQKLSESCPILFDDLCMHSEDIYLGWNCNNIAYQDCLINYVAESDYETDFLSEKTFKCVVSGTVPIFTSWPKARHFIGLGFKYPLELINFLRSNQNINHFERCQKLVEYINTLEKQQIVNMYSKLAKHNREYFYTKFYNRFSSANSETLHNFVRTLDASNN